MPVHDYVCPACGHRELNSFFMNGASSLACPACTSPMDILWSRSASVGFSQPIEFTDDDGTHYSFSTPEEAHRFERRTEDEVAAGLRSRPFVFRELSQDRSNFDRNVFQHLHPQRQREELTRRREKLVTRPRGGPMISGGAVEVCESEVVEEEA